MKEEQEPIESSSIMLLSSVHGRDRRETRQIPKVTLNAAVKHGTREAEWRRTKNGMVLRYKYTFMDTVVITDSTSLQEVTSYVLPVEIHPIVLQKEDFHLHNLLHQRLSNNPHLVTSHHVFVVDRSSSMRKCDVVDFKRRIDAVFGNIALDGVGKLIDSAETCETDVISLIEFSDSCQVSVHREPVTNVLFNKLVERIDTIEPKGHGIFWQVLVFLAEFLELESQLENCAVSVTFLSDGKPSDVSIQDFPSYASFEEYVAYWVRTLVQLFPHRLTFTCIGFASPMHDFETLKYMVAVANQCGAFHSTFLHATGNRTSLSTAMSTVTSQLQASKVNLSRGGRVNSVRTLRSLVTLEQFFVPHLDLPLEDKTGWTFYDWAQNNKFEKSQAGGWKWIKEPQLFFQSQSIDGLAMRARPFAHGSERIVYSVILYKKARRNGEALVKRWPVGKHLIAKEPLYQHDEDKKWEFHETFCQTQARCQKLARKFNQNLEEVLQRKLYKLKDIPYLEFLPCSVFEILPHMYSSFSRGVLVESMLEYKNYKKWNDNNGYVLGQPKVVGRNLKQLLLQNPAVVAAAPAVKVNAKVNAPRKVTFQLSDSDDSHDDDDETIQEDYKPVSGCALEPVEKLNPSDFPQAFSHWTYRYSNRVRLVCDIQGVFQVDDNGRGVFRLTDPVIHFVSESNRKRVHGATDLGSQGMIAFFMSHQCNQVCKHLGLSSYKPTL